MFQYKKISKSSFTIYKNQVSGSNPGWIPDAIKRIFVGRSLDQGYQY